ncbi:MAG: prephenate dehydratase [Eubacteriales bacterium]|nr:prephenate dehydratase [Eubacteriales bacterium]
MTDLEKYRLQIDEADAKIVELFEHRMKLAESVADYKIKSGKAVFDQQRENQKIEKVKELAHGEFNKRGVEELFQQLMAVSRKRQYQLLTENGIRLPVDYIRMDKLYFHNAKVVFQGVIGAYSFQAMQTFFDDTIEPTHVNTWKEAMEQVSNGEADFAVLPIENSTAGIVSDMYDLLLQYNNYIVGEQIIKIDHTLMALPGTRPEDISVVYSHPQALAQCRDFLGTHPEWKQVEFLNTAMAAEKVARDGRKNQAAIGSRSAAEYYGLDILKDSDMSKEKNSTRFIIISHNRAFVKDAQKISICFGLPHSCGSLYGMLSHFIYNGLNMFKIESRPIPDKPFEYRFFIDFEGNLSEPAVKNALRGIEAEAGEFKLLGNY